MITPIKVITILKTRSNIITFAENLSIQTTKKIDANLVLQVTNLIDLYTVQKMSKVNMKNIAIIREARLKAIILEARLRTKLKKAQMKRPMESQIKKEIDQNTMCR